MSCYVVSVDTVRLLVGACDRYELDRVLADAYPHDDRWRDGSDDDKRGMVLRYVLSVNARAVLYRYPTDTVDTMPGSVGDVGWQWDTQYRPMPAVEYVPLPFRTSTGPGQEMSEHVARRVLGAAHCLAYQCCELPEWESTPAYRWLNRLHWRAGSALSEGWEVDDVREAVA